MTMRILILVAGLLLGAAASASAQGVGFGRSELDVLTEGGKRTHFTVELAKTPEQLARGLMFRRSLAADAGMLFDFGSPRPVAMWMKNTLIPLDMLFLDREGRIVYVEEFAVPETLDPRGPSDPVLAVLELPGGTARRLHIRPGDRVAHPLFRQAP